MLNWLIIFNFAICVSAFSTNASFVFLAVRAIQVIMVMPKRRQLCLIETSN